MKPRDHAGFSRRDPNPRTKLVIGETIGNPGLEVLDIPAVAAIAHAAGLPLLIDNTFATPYLSRPIEQGADIVMHSLTKWMGGHGLVIGGVLVDGGRFDWIASGRHATMIEPYAGYHGLVFAEHFGPSAFIMRARTEGLRDFGACLSPHNAARLLTGVETLSLRMQRHVENTAAVLKALSGNDAVTWVAHPSLPSHPDHDLAARLLPRGAGSIVSFGVSGGRLAGRKFIEALELASHLANVGDAKTLVIHPASTTHQQMSAEQLAAGRNRRGHGAPFGRPGGRRRHRRRSRQALRASQRNGKGPVMRLEVDRLAVFGGAGGKPHAPGQPLVVFLHGAGMDHSVWALQSRWFAHHGFSVLAVDLPGHGGSDGPALADIGAMADWTARLIGSARAERAALVGHSMGALVALETAARHADVVSGMALLNAAARMPVHPDLLAAAKANSHAAVDMVSLWGLGAAATLGGASAPGTWMLGGTQRLLEKAAAGVLHLDLAACNAFETGAAAAAKVNCPTTLILSERDQMTPLAGGRALAALIPNARTRVLAGGHMSMVERPDEVLDALRAAVGI